MEARLKPAVLTREDTKIWLNINLPLNRAAPNPMPGIGYFKADARDATIMWYAQTAPLCECCQEQMSRMYVAGWPIDIRGTVRS